MLIVGFVVVIVRRKRRMSGNRNKAEVASTNTRDGNSTFSRARNDFKEKGNDNIQGRIVPTENKLQQNDPNSDQ